MSDREKFEQWIVENRPDAELYRRDVKGSTRFGEYCKRAVQEQWEVWQASRRADALEAAYFRIAELEAKCRLYEASLDKADAERDALAKDSERYRFLAASAFKHLLPTAETIDAAIAKEPK
jgi:hypothetical protein